MPVTRSFGPATIVALDDGASTFFRPRADAFPTATPQLWRRADAADPGAVTPDGQWFLRFRCFAVRHASRDGWVLVDAGIGPADAPAATWAPVPGRLPAELAAAGIDTGDVRAVVITHLHTDHIGWAVVGAGEPYFPNARYVLQQAEIAVVDRINPALDARLLDPLRAAGQLQAVAGEATLAPGVRAIPTPGHTPGHQSVLVDAGEDHVLLTGDLLVHAIQLVDPTLPYAFEVDQEAARVSRTALLRDLAARGRATLGTPHLTEPFTPVN